MFRTLSLRPRWLSTAALVLACASLLGGCVVFKSAEVAPQGPLGVARVTAVVCATDKDESTGSNCTDAGRGGEDGQDRTTAAVLGFLVPEGTDGPDTFAGAIPGEPSLLFAPSNDYTEKLNTAYAPPAGFVWLGYASNVFEYSASGGPQQFSITVDLQLPQGTDGAPFSGPFRSQVVVGEDPPGSGPCQCVDSVRPTGNPGSLANVFTTAVNDAGILGGAPVDVSRGTTGTVPFTLAYEGADPGADFTLSAATTVPGATATPSAATLRPAGTSTTPVAADVAVPAGTAPGSYDVTLTATMGDQVRRQTRTLVVPGPPKNVERPGFTGAQQEGSTLTASDGTWEAVNKPSFTRRWRRCDAAGASCADIAGATGATYALSAADVGKTLRVRITAANADGTTESDSPASGNIVAAAPAQGGSPSTPAAADTTPPALTLNGLPKTVKRAALLRGLSVKIDRSEPAALAAELLATPRKATSARASAFELVLARARTPRAAGTVSLKLRPAKKLIGRARRFSVRVAVTAIDASGNETIVRRTLKVR